MATACSHYDVDRFGAGLPRFSPRQADVLFVVGTISHKMAPVLKRIYDQMTEPKWVVAFGVCTCTGGFYDNYATVQGIDTIIPVDVYIPGCPPRPESVLDGLHEAPGEDRRRARSGTEAAARRAWTDRHPRAAARALRRRASLETHADRGDHTAVVGLAGRCSRCCASAGTSGAPVRHADGPHRRGLPQVPRPRGRPALRGRLPSLLGRRTTTGCASRCGSRRTTPASRPRSPSGPSPTGSSARCGTCSACASPAHPDLRRLLLYEEFVGHPLRKDYPINRRQPLIGPELSSGSP